MNVERMLQLADHIEANPSNFDMRMWHQIEGINAATLKNFEECLLWKELAHSDCQTAHCIAGTAVMLWKDLIKDAGASSRDNARIILDLTDNEADMLFYKGNWPSSYRDKYDDDRAHVAAAELIRDLANGIVRPMGELIR